MDKKIKDFLIANIFVTLSVVLFGLFTFLGIVVNGGSRYMQFFSYGLVVQCGLSIVALVFLIKATFGKDKKKK